MGLRGIGSYSLSARPEQPADGDRLFTREVVELFLELERDPKGYLTYSEKSYRLATLLGLENEWWSSNHVNDRTRVCPWVSPSFVGHAAFHRCRKIREELLAICEERGDLSPPPATEAAEPPTAA